MTGRVLVVMLATTTVVVAAPASTARLEADGACELSTLETRTNELLGRAALTPDARARITVHSMQHAELITATLTVNDDSGAALSSRTIAATSCDELVESAAVVISLVLQQPALAPPPAPPPPAAAPAPIAPTTETHAAYVPVRAASSTKAIDIGARLGSTLASALVIGGRLDRSTIALALDLAIAMPATIELPAGSVGILDMRLEAAACARVRGFAACGVAIGGLVRGEGDELMETRSAIRPLAGIGGRVEWRQIVSPRAGVRVFASAEQLLVQPGFLVDGQPVYTSAARQAWLGAGIFLQVP